MESPILIHRVIARLNIGGPALHVVNLAAGLDNSLGFRTRLLAGEVTEDEGDMAFYARDLGVEVTEVPTLNRLLSPVQDLRALWALYRWFRRERPLVVHTHTAKAGTLGRFAALLARVPVRVHTYHGHVLGGGYFSPTVTRIYLWIERILARISHRLIVLSKSQEDEMVEELRVAVRDRFSVVPLGLDLEPFRAMDRADAREIFRRRLGIGEEELVVGIVGRLVPVKNHQLLLRAHSILEERVEGRVRILVVGSGSEEMALRALTEELGMDDRVTWMGWQEGLEHIYPALDAVALTSLDEGTPVAILEALASGTPVVARAVGGVPDLLEGVELGRLVFEATPEAVAEGLEFALGKNVGPEEVERIRLDISRRFSSDRLVEDLKALYLKELDRKGRLPPSIPGGSTA